MASDDDNMAMEELVPGTGRAANRTRSVQSPQFREEERSGPERRHGSKWRITTKEAAIGILIGVVVVLIMVIVIQTYKSKTSQTAYKDGNTALPTFPDAITLDKMMSHLNELQDIAIAHHNSRDGRYGHNASAEYVIDQLKQYTDYRIQVQPFTYDTSYELSPARLTMLEPEARVFENGKDFRPLSGIAAGTITGQLFQAARNGCTVDDMPAGLKGNVALIIRGNCTFFEKLNSAAAAGAVGALVYTLPGQDLIHGNAGTPMPAIPGFLITDSAGAYLLDRMAGTSVVVTMLSDTKFERIYTHNVIASMPPRSGQQSIVSGSHLDGVSAGPGINDNGSGSMMNLVLALEWAVSGQATTSPNNVIFAWWGGEEYGLLGSYYYVDQLVKSKQLGTIALNLNFDMVGSSNFQRGVMDGRHGPHDVYVGSGYIQGLFEDHFASLGLTSTPLEFNGRSDYGPFIEVGIPAGGLETGAEVIKNEEQRVLFGGVLNAAFDTCYHQACDNIYNINTEVYAQNAEAAAFVLQELAADHTLSCRMGLCRTRDGAEPAYAQRTAMPQRTSIRIEGVEYQLV